MLSQICCAAVLGCTTNLCKSSRFTAPQRSCKVAHQRTYRASIMLALRTMQRSSRLLATRAASTTPVALVGCGMPGRGMGWYHVGTRRKINRFPAPASHDLSAGQADSGWRRAVRHFNRYRGTLVPRRRKGRPRGRRVRRLQKRARGQGALPCINSGHAEARRQDDGHGPHAASFTRCDGVDARRLQE